MENQGAPLVLAAASHELAGRRKPGSAREIAIRGSGRSRRRGERILTGTTNVTLEAIGLYRTVDDLIVDVDDGSGEPTVTANRPDTVRVPGVSLVGSSAVTTGVSASVGYTYSRSQQKNESSRTASATRLYQPGARMSARQKRNRSPALMVRPSRGAQASVDHRPSGARCRSRSRSDFVCRTSPRFSAFR